MELKSMKLSKSDAKEMNSPSKLDESKYPWGMRIELNNESMKKLGMKKLPEVGKKCVIYALAVVERVSENSTQDGTRQDMSLQITDLDIEAYTEKKEAEKTLYEGE